MDTPTCFSTIFTRGTTFVTPSLLFWKGKGKCFTLRLTGPHRAVGSMPDSRARGSGFDTWSGHIVSLLLLIQEGQLLVTGENMCT